MRVCTVCCDDLVEVVFSCPRQCNYSLCAPCIKLAFEDQAGENAQCPLCKTKGKDTSIALPMVESLCGKGAVREVERELRSKVELEHMREEERKKKGEAEMAGMRERALRLFNDLSERLNMRCPRCKIVFYDYDGCNALSCKCGAGFCAICLQDCGADAHSHVGNMHGGLFDKALFERERPKREKTTVANFMQEIREEPFEVQQFVRIEYEKSRENKVSVRDGGEGTAFLKSAKKILKTAVKNDRLSLINNNDLKIPGRHPEPYGHMHISPRNAIPEDYRLMLTDSAGSICKVILQKRVGERWVSVCLPEDDNDRSLDEATVDSEAENAPIVDVLCNLRQQLRFGVIAFVGETQLYQTKPSKNDSKDKVGSDEVSIMFYTVSSAGDVDYRPQTLSAIGCANRAILGINQNRRLSLLSEHVGQCEDNELLFPSLCDYVGAGRPHRLLADISVPPMDSIKELNIEQQSVAHPLCMRTAREVAGPPGTGKTKTITELVRSILECTSFDVIVLSERNGAIDAIAQKIAHDCISFSKILNEPSVKDIQIWSRLVAFGSSSLGPSTSLFTFKNKMTYHPEIRFLARNLAEKRTAQKKHRDDMLTFLAASIRRLEEKLPYEVDPEKTPRSELIEAMRTKAGSGTGLNSCGVIASTVCAACEAWKKLDSVSYAELQEPDIESAVLDFDDNVGNLIPIRDEPTKLCRPWMTIRSEMCTVIHAIAECLEMIENHRLFSHDKVESLQLEVRQAEDNLKATRERIETELVTDARVFLCTIGSSHKLPAPDMVNDGLKDEGPNSAFGRSLIPPNKPTVVIFDEAGCIPCFEFLGLSRLGRDIKALVCVGDKLQLAPYNPEACSRPVARFNQQGRRDAMSKGNSSLLSLLDVSKLKVDNDDKIRLTKQYRVPRDIAGVLNARVYKGQYHTAVGCTAPLQGFNLIDVDSPLRTRESKYVNENEADYSIELIRQTLSNGDENIMVLRASPPHDINIEF